MSTTLKSTQAQAVPTGVVKPLGKTARPKAPKPSMYEEASSTPRVAAIYARVSTEEQAKGESVETQVRLCTEFIAKEKPAWKVGAVFRDEGKSGKNDDRPGFKELVEAVDEGRVNAVVCYHLDRFSRNLHDIMVYFKKFEDKKVYMAFTDERFDFSTVEGRVQFNFLAVFADWYLKNLSRETKRGKATRILHGQQNNLAPFGYRKVPGKPPQVVPREAKGRAKSL